ncbi:MAG TPA: hypothetical protein VFL17_03185 [Anaerolineae bacterium]|nr:hypothetical protein [Anaerolineae bacterium]
MSYIGRFKDTRFRRKAHAVEVANLAFDLLAKGHVRFCDGGAAGNHDLPALAD